MEQTFATQRFSTLTRYVQLSADSVLVLHVHTLPENEDGSGSSSPKPTSYGLPPPFSWLEERHMQELLVMVHEVVHVKAVQGISGTLPPSKKSGSTTSGTQDFQLKRGTNLRVLFNFKSHSVSQHIALPTDPNPSPLLPSASTHMTAQGQLVFESTGFKTSGSGFRSFRSVQSSLHVFVDPYEPTSTHGVVKIMLLLCPDHKQSQDVLSYFQPRRKREGSSSEGEEEGGGEGVLAELPVEGLKRRCRGGVAGTHRERGRGRGASSRGKAGGQKKSSKMKEKRPCSSLRAQPQPTIVQSLAGVTGRSTAHSMNCLRKQVPARTHSSSIDELFGMGSEWLSDGDDGDGGGGDSGGGGDGGGGGGGGDGGGLAGCDSGRVESPVCSSGSAHASSYNSASVANTAATHDSEGLASTSAMDGVWGSFSPSTPPLTAAAEEGGDGEALQSVTGDIAASSMGGVWSPFSLRTPSLTATGEEDNSDENKSLSQNFVGSPASQNATSSSLPAQDGEQCPPSPARLPRSRQESQDRVKTTRRLSLRLKDRSCRKSGKSGASHSNETSPEKLSEHSKTDSQSSSQPFEDITNVTETRDTPDASRSSMKTHSQRQTLDEFFMDGPPVADASTVDLTGEAPIVLSSDEDSVSAPHHSTEHSNTEGKQKKRKFISPKTLFKGAKDLREVPERSIRRWLCQQKQLLVHIFQRKVYSRRHESFITCAKNRAALLHQISAHLLSKEQDDVITQGLMKAFCYKNMNYFSYVMSVLYPECLIRLIMDYHSLPFDLAERKMMGLDEELELELDSDE